MTDKPVVEGIDKEAMISTLREHWPIAADRMAELEAKIKRQAEWIGEARQLLEAIEVVSLKLPTMVECSDWMLRRDALLEDSSD